jgi:hypothetical protein
VNGDAESVESVERTMSSITAEEQQMLENEIAQQVFVEEPNAVRVSS